MTDGKKAGMGSKTKPGLLLNSRSASPPPALFSAIRAIILKPGIGIPGHVGNSEQDGKEDISIIHLKDPAFEIIDTVLYTPGILYKSNYFYVLL